MDNSQFTEEERAEAFRVESMRQLVRQTKALESVRGTLVFFVIAFLCTALVLLMFGLMGR